MAIFIKAGRKSTHASDLKTSGDMYMAEPVSPTWTAQVIQPRHKYSAAIQAIVRGIGSSPVIL